MGRTSSAVKDKYNAKAYDEIKVRVSKGQKDTIQAHAQALGESVNGFINRAINDAIEASENPFIPDDRGAKRIVGDNVYDIYYRKRIERDKTAPDANKEESGD